MDYLTAILLVHGHTYITHQTERKKTIRYLVQTCIIVKSTIFSGTNWKLDKSGGGSFWDVSACWKEISGSSIVAILETFTLQSLRQVKTSVLRSWKPEVMSQRANQIKEVLVITWHDMYANINTRTAQVRKNSRKGFFCQKKKDILYVWDNGIPWTHAFSTFGKF